MIRTAHLPRWVPFALASSLLLVAVSAAGLIWLSLTAGRAPLPALGRMPAFTLTDQTGKPFSSASLQGKFTAVGFIYTSCPDICPMLTTRMTELQGELRRAGLLGTEAVLLSISVDPGKDTPAVLAQYAAGRGADWTFLTGNPTEIREVVSGGFKVGAEKHEGHDGTSYEVSHSGKIALVDPQGVIRAYYDGEQLDPAHVLADIQKLR